jgi:hypothetical protein
LACNPDGGTLVGIVVLILFVAVMGGLLSKDKETRQNALVGASILVLGIGALVVITSC